MRNIGGELDAGESGFQVIRLRLMRAREMFELSPTDLFSEYRNFLTGVDFCLSELRGRRSARPVRLEILLPPEEIETRWRAARPHSAPVLRAPDPVQPERGQRRSGSAASARCASAAPSARSA